MNQSIEVRRLRGWGLTESPSKGGKESCRERGLQCSGKDSGQTPARAVRILAAFQR